MTFDPHFAGRSLAVSVFALIAVSPALADRIEIASKIDAVTVYPDAAQAARIAEAQLPAGAHSLVLKGLPMNLDPDSLRVEGAGESGISIGSVETRVVPAARPQDDSTLAARLQRLQMDREGVTARMEALQAKKTMIERYAQASPEKLGEKSSPMDVEQWANAWDAVGEGLAKIAVATLEARQSLKVIDQEIRALQASNRQAGQMIAPTREATIEIEAASATKARLVVSYRVAGAGWRPHYDARLTSASGTPSLELIRRAAVMQRTGEDWTNVSLIVSTVRARRGVAAPDVLVERLKIFEPPPPVAQRPMPASRARRNEAPDSFAAGKLASPGVESAPVAMAEAREQEAALETGAYETQFRVPGRVDIPGDGSSRSLRLGSSKIAPEMSVRIAPAFDTSAYLDVAFTNKDDAPLLPGAVNIQRDGMYVGRGHIQLVAPGEETRLGFGVDDGVKVTRVPVSRKEAGPGWLGSNKSEVKDFRTSVRNLHQFPVKVSMIDRMPISEDAKITIEPLSSNTPPTQNIVEGRRGVMAWNFDLAPKAQREIRTGWQVKWPADKRLISETLPDGVRN